MSVINQMLKDLEKRRGKRPSAKGPMSLTSVDLSGLVASSKKFWLFLVIMIIALGVGLWWLLKEEPAAPTETSVKTETQLMIKPLSTVLPKIGTEAVVFSGGEKAVVSKVIAAGTHSPLSEAAVLEYINITQNRHQTMVRFMLSHRIHYQLTASQDHERLTLNLDNTELGQAIPAVENNPVIKSLQMQEEPDGDLVLHIQVQSDTVVQSLKLTEEVPIELVLTLENKKLDEKAIAEAGEMKAAIVPLTLEEQAEQSYKDALYLLEEDSPIAAIKKMKLILQTAPTFQPARKTLIVLLIDQGRYDVAHEYLQAGLKQSPKSVPYLTLYARLLVDEKQPKSALRVLQRVSPPLEDNLDYYALMAVIRQRLGEPLIAAQIYEQLLQYQSSNGIWWMGLGVALESAGKKNTAVHAYERALQTGALNPTLRAYVKNRIMEISG